MLTIDPNQIVIHTLVFILGLLIGGFLFTGGGRKWKQRYYAEVDRRKELETSHAEAERNWRERDSLRGAAAKDRDRDGIDDRREVIVDKVDRDGDGIDDRREV
jgi:hypothetical protein